MKWEIDLVRDYRDLDELIQELEPEEFGFVMRWHSFTLETPEPNQMVIDDPQTQRLPSVDAIWDMAEIQRMFPTLKLYRIQTILKKLCRSEHFYRLRLRHWGKFAVTLYTPRVFPYQEEHDCAIWPQLEVAAHWKGLVGKDYTEEEGDLVVHWIAESEKGDRWNRSYEVEVNGTTHAYDY